MLYCASHAATAVKCWRRALMAGQPLPQEVWSEILIDALLREGSRHLNTAIRRHIMRPDNDHSAMCSGMILALDAFGTLGRVLTTARRTGDIV